MKDLSTIILDGVLGTLEPKEVNHMVEQPSNQGFYDTWFGQTKKWRSWTTHHSSLCFQEDRQEWLQWEQTPEIHRVTWIHSFRILCFLPNLMVGHYVNIVGFEKLDLFLRHYPLRFASKVIENIPAFQHFSGRFKTTPQAHAVLGSSTTHGNKHGRNPTGWAWKPCQVPGLLHERFERFAWTQTAAWDGANLKETMFYLRRSKLILLPQEWKKLIPVDEASLNSFCS